MRLDLAQPNCRCQGFSVSDYSAGPVEDDEILARILVSPQHMGSKGKPRAAALTDAERNGLSLFRDDRAKDHEIRKVAEGLVEKARLWSPEKAGVFGVLMIRGGIVRSCRRDTEDMPCYCLYDTALVDSTGHAEVYQRVAGVEDAVRDDRRKHLFGLVKDSFVPVAEFRNGLLLDLAPPGLVGP